MALASHTLLGLRVVLDCRPPSAQSFTGFKHLGKRAAPPHPRRADPGKLNHEGFVVVDVNTTYTTGTK